jgi:PAS domain S-box-containing protein
VITEAAIREARILIVDDQEANVALLAALLEEAGYTHVASTMNPKEVCRIHRRDSYDLILLDLQMPGMDGFEVIEGLRVNEADGFLPVLVLTAQPAHKMRALQAGVRDFISKPFDLMEVKTRIRNTLEVRLLYRQLDQMNNQLEATVRERTAELRESEARYRSLTELASDWYWEQDAHGAFTRVSGPVLEMLGIRVDNFAGQAADNQDGGGWDQTQRAALHAKLAAREPFLDLVFSRRDGAGGTLKYQVSGQPMFDRSARFVGYRGIGIQLPGNA